METGYLSENKNIDDFIKGIKIFLENDELRNNAGIAARKEIELNFILDKMINNYINLYQEIWEKCKVY
jgi:glycosyltransferase involved in cell wall biosynthesis